MIANDIINSPLRSHPEFSEVDRIAKLLTLPFEGANHAPSHPSISGIIASEVKQMAAVYDFDRNSGEAAWKIMLSDRRAHHVYRTCRSPHASVLFEVGATGLSDENDQRYGLFVEGDREDFLLTVFMGSSHAIPLFQVRNAFVDESEIDADFIRRERSGRMRFFETRWFNLLGGSLGSEMFPGVRKPEVYFIKLVAALWAFLGVGGATVVTETLTREGRIAKKRGKFRSMSAINSFNRVRLNLPGGIENSSATHFTRGPGVRLHDVRGHWRELEVDGNKVLRWIAAFWRGDARLGVVVKHREVHLNERAGRGRMGGNF